MILLACLAVAIGADAARPKQKKKTVRTEQKSTAPKKKKAAPARSRKNVESERRKANEQIRQTKEDIRRNNERTERQLNALASLDGQIRSHRDEISSLQVVIDSIDRRTRALADTIARAESDVARLRENSRRSLREARKNRQAMTDVNLIFSSSTFSEGAKRVSYLKQLQRWRTRKTSDLRQSLEVLANKKKALGMLRDKHGQALASLSDSKRRLEAKQVQTRSLVDSLRRENKSLQTVLAERRRRAQALDAELDRIIEQEARRAEEERRAEEARIAAARQKEAARVEAAPGQVKAPAVNPPKDNKEGKNATDTRDYPGRADEERRLSGSFASNKGRLLFPVAGKYNITGTFGRNAHSELSRVEVNNPGIDIEVPAGSTARAVFDGTVSYIFRMDGYQNVVMVRHGSYLTVYAHIDGLSVRKGDKVKAGQAIGSIFSDPTNSGRCTLHFEVRNEREKLNPLQWVR